MNPFFKAHVASVETFTGPTSTGDGYAAPVDVQGLFDDGLQLVVSEGVERIEGKAKFFADLADRAKFLPESRVTVKGLVFQVDRVHEAEAGSLFEPVTHVEVWLK